MPRDFSLVRPCDAHIVELFERYVPGFLSQVKYGLYDMI